MEGPPARGSGLYPLRRQISAGRQVRLLHPLPSFCAGSSADENSWPTPNRCGFNSRTAHHASAGVADDIFLRPLHEYIAPGRADVVRTFGEPLPKGLELESTANCLSSITALTS